MWEHYVVFMRCELVSGYFHASGAAAAMAASVGFLSENS